MILNPKEVEHIAELAQLKLRQEEKELFRQQLSAILDFAACLRQVDTSNITLTSGVLPYHTVLRNDEPRTGLASDILLNNAPQIKDQQFRVPPVFE